MRLIRVQLISTKSTRWFPVGNDTGLSHAQPAEQPARSALNDLCTLELGKRAQHGQRQLPIDRDLLAVLEKFADGPLVFNFASDAVGQRENRSCRTDQFSNRPVCD
jgi:hypothetical protein